MSGIDVLSHFIRLGHHEVLNRTVSDTCRIEHPTTEFELRSLMGWFNTISRFMLKLARIDAQLHQKIGKDPLQIFQGLTKDKIATL